MTPKTHLPQTAKIVEWDQQKGFGYLQVGKQRVFLHWKDFTERQRRPAVGDVVSFELGSDPKGRRCAINAQQVNKGGRVSFLTWGVFAGLMVLPVLALRELDTNLLWLIGYALAINVLTYWRQHDPAWSPLYE